MVESVPGQFIAVVHYLTKPDEVLMNPVRGDHFRHLESACKYAKRVIRGKPYRAPKPK